MRRANMVGKIRAAVGLALPGGLLRLVTKSGAQGGREAATAKAVDMPELFDALDALGDALRNDNEGNTSLTALSLRNNRLCGAGYGSETSGTRFAETDNSGMLRFATALAKRATMRAARARFMHCLCVMECL